MSQIGFSIGLPALLHMAWDDRIWSQGFDEIERFKPSVKDLWCFYLFGPVIVQHSSLVLPQTKPGGSSRGFEDPSAYGLEWRGLPQVSAPSVHRIATDDCLLRRQPEECMIDRVAL